jgi:5-methylcytosine-specific restriction endonuclease McrA
VTARPTHRPRSGHPAGRAAEAAHAHGRTPAAQRGHPDHVGPEPRGRSRRRKPQPAQRTPQLTSLPTGRRAYSDTRQWLLDRHGPVCAYCGLRHEPDLITLDHVTPRRGQTAYDRRDNLVLACKRCNGKKADTPILAFLLERRERAASLLRYGLHLSPMLVDLARQIAGEEAAARAERLADPDYPYAD